MAETHHLLHLTLIRHAPSLYQDGTLPPSDPAADCSDEEAFSRLASHMPGEAIWWVSPLLRTRMTADALIKAGASAKEQKPDRLLEEQDYGAWHGRPISAIWEEIKDGPLTRWHFLHPDIVPPDGESFAMLWARAARLRLSIETCGADHLVLIGHAMIFRALIGQMLGLEMETALGLGIAPLSRSELVHLRPIEKTSTDNTGGSWMLDQLNIPA